MQITARNLGMVEEYVGHGLSKMTALNADFLDGNFTFAVIHRFWTIPRTFVWINDVEIWGPEWLGRGNYLGNLCA